MSSPNTQPQTKSSTITAKALLAFAIGCAFFSYAFLQRVLPSVMVDELMRDFSVGAAVLGGLSAFYFYAYAGMQIPVGALLDRFGPRRLLPVAMLACVLGNVLFAVSDNIPMASTGRFLIGGAVASSYIGALTIAANIFPQNRFGMLAGVLQAVGMAGAIVGQAPMRLVVEGIGWRSTMMAMGAVAFVLAVAAFLTIPRRAEHHPRPAHLLEGMGAVLSNKQTWAAALTGCSMAAPLLAFASLWAVPWMRSSYGFGTTEAAAFASVYFVSWGLSSPFTGWISDWLGRRKPVLLIGLILEILGLAALVYLPDLSKTTMVLLLVISGAGGGTMILAYACAREGNDSKNGGAAMGLVNTFITGSGAIFQPLIGFLLDLNWTGTAMNGARVYAPETYSIAFIAFVVAGAIGCTAVSFMRETGPGRRHVSRTVRD